MKTLWVFGDSHTEGDGCIPKFEYYEHYRKEGDMTWPQHLAQYLNLNLINRGKGGASNDTILDRIIESFYKIKKGDIVIIGKTYSNRFDFPQQSGLNTIFLDLKELEQNNTNLEFTLEQIKCIIDFKYYFMGSPLYDERWDTRYKWIKKVLEDRGCNVVIWDVVLDLKEIQTIRHVTKGKVKDDHMSFNGHKEFADTMWTKWFKEKSLI
jgi:hypothetical protein